MMMITIVNTIITLPVLILIIVNSRIVIATMITHVRAHFKGKNNNIKNTDNVETKRPPC